MNKCKTGCPKTMRYRYVTKTMAKNAAKKGLKAAVECSARKWWWYGTCTREQLDKKLTVGLDVGENCTLCFYAESDCFVCPLKSCTCYDDPFQQAADAVFAYSYSKTTLTNFRKFQAKARKLARIIEKL